MSDDSPTLTDAEGRMLCALSQKFRSIRRLAKVLRTTPATIDRIVWRRRRIRPSTMAKIRVALQRAAREHRIFILLPGVH